MSTTGAVLALDLAAKYSAACLLDAGAVVRWQVDSWGRTESEFIDLVTLPFQAPYGAAFTAQDGAPGVLAVEDLPHRLPFSSLVKHVCRIQGRITERMHQHGAVDRVLFVPPAEWRRVFDGLGTGTGPKAVTAVAAALGYTPPDLDPRCGKAGDKAIARKVATDYCAAYLIGRWAVHTHERTGGYDTLRTSRYATAAQHTPHHRTDSVGST